MVNYILDQVGYDGPGIIGRRRLDPACGSGRFLVEAARRLVEVLQERIGFDGASGITPQALVNERLRNSLFGMDVNRFACFLAEVNLLLQVLADGGHHGFIVSDAYQTEEHLPNVVLLWMYEGQADVKSNAVTKAYGSSAIGVQFAWAYLTANDW